MSDPTVKQQIAAAVRRAERLANPDPDFADSVAAKCFETDIEIWAASLKPKGDRMDNTDLDLARECAEQQRANYTPPSCDRLRDDL